MQTLIFLAVLNYSLAFAGTLILERPVDLGPYFLVGSCDQALAEIKKISPNSHPACVCHKNVCKTELTSHLSTEIQKMLKIVPDLTTDVGPNCFGSVLYAEGLNPNLENSINENIELFIYSPFCEEVKGRPAQGDIIHILYSHNNWAKINGEAINGPDFLGDNHTYLALTENLAFNKSSPDPADPYEIINVNNYLDREKIPEVCRFTGVEHALSKKCADIAVAYRCKNLKAVQIIDNNSAPSDKSSYKDAMISLARQKLNIPKFRDLPQNLQEAFLENRKREGYFNHNGKIEQMIDMFNDYTARIYILAAPDMTVTPMKKDYEIILQARKLGLYPKASLEDRIKWANIYFQTVIDS